MFVSSPVCMQDIKRSGLRPAGWAAPNGPASPVPLSTLLLAQSGIEQMREPDACLLQLLADDRGVHRDIGRVDLHVARWLIAGRTLSNAVSRRAETLLSVVVARCGWLYAKRCLRWGNLHDEV